MAASLCFGLMLGTVLVLVLVPVAFSIYARWVLGASFIEPTDRPAALPPEPIVAETSDAEASDEQDRETGTLSKAECHDGDGLLHRAFSVFLFDDAGRLLLQQRAAGKRLWPLYWSNSCCSHPRSGETVPVAAERRLQDELHTGAELEFVYKFIYAARYGELGSERELCHVFVGRAGQASTPNPTEIAAVDYVDPASLESMMQSERDDITPWFRMEWRELVSEHADVLRRYCDLP